MANLKHTCDRACARLALWKLAAIIYLFPALLRGQIAAREALSSFPADTQQITYSNLAQLRAVSNYAQIRSGLLNRQFNDFEAFLRSVGVDPEADVDEVVLGWRGEATSATGYFGLAEGRFQPERVHDYFVAHKLPVSEHAGQELFAFGSGQDRGDLFFAFLTSSTGAFGRVSDLKAVLDVRAGSRPALDSNSAFVNWEAELEGASPQWGVATGKAAANQAAPWLTGGQKLPVDPKALFDSVQAVLYRIDWSDGFTTHLSIVCRDSQNAATLGQLFNLWRTARQMDPSDSPPGIKAFIQGLDLQVEGARVEVTGSGPLEIASAVLRGPTGNR